jgi:Peptidase A4 family
MLRRLIAVLPIVIVATLLVSEGSAQAILPVKKSLFYVGPLISASARGIPTSSAATNFTVPALSCGTASTDTGIVFGSGIYSAESNWVSAGGVVAECLGGSPVYTAQMIIDNDVSDLSVTPAAGDVISTSVSITSGETQVTFDDVTRNSSTTNTVPGGSVATYLLLGGDIDRNPSVTGVPNFGTVKFTNASFNGKSAGKNTGVKIADLYNSAKVLMATSSQLNAKGNKFSLKFVSSGG